MTRPDDERPHPSDPPDLGRHYSDRAERALREAGNPHDLGGRVVPEAERYLAAAQAIALALMGIGERMARLSYAANRIHHALAQIDANAHGAGERVDSSDQPVVEPLDPIPPEHVNVPGHPEVGPEQGWTPSSGDTAPRGTSDPTQACVSCSHDLDYPPAPGCQRPNSHSIPF